ncbi:MAG: hypothetical protein RLZZ245_3578, partial [Verrucomicrobiota bacterium]
MINLDNDFPGKRLAALRNNSAVYHDVYQITTPSSRLGDLTHAGLRQH